MKSKDMKVEAGILIGEFPIEGYEGQVSGIRYQVAGIRGQGAGDFPAPCTLIPAP